MARIIISMLILVLAAGCTTTTTLRGPGDEGISYAIHCSGVTQSWAGCVRAAWRKCGNAGYDIVGAIAEPYAVAGQSIFGGAGSQSISRTLIIECRGGVR